MKNLAEHGMKTKFGDRNTDEKTSHIVNVIGRKPTEERAVEENISDERKKALKRNRER